MKTTRMFHLKVSLFLVVKLSIYLNRRVFVTSLTRTSICHNIERYRSPSLCIKTGQRKAIIRWRGSVMVHKYYGVIAVLTWRCSITRQAYFCQLVPENLWYCVHLLSSKIQLSQVIWLWIYRIEFNQYTVTCLKSLKDLQEIERTYIMADWRVARGFHTIFALNVCIST